MADIVSRLKTFMEDEARSCSMDFGCITPQYVYRMWGGSVPLNEIVRAMRDIKEITQNTTGDDFYVSYF